MWMIGCDFHPGWRQVAWLDLETGETGEGKLEHKKGEAERWYRELPVRSLIGLEATGNSDWFVELLQKLEHEVWIGDAAKIRASYMRKQKNDKRDAQHILRLLRERRFPRLWRPTAEQCDVPSPPSLRTMPAPFSATAVAGYSNYESALDDAHPHSISRDRSHRE